MKLSLGAALRIWDCYLGGLLLPHSSPPDNIVIYNNDRPLSNPLILGSEGDLLPLGTGIEIGGDKSGT